MELSPEVGKGRMLKRKRVTRATPSFGWESNIRSLLKLCEISEI